MENKSYGKITVGVGSSKERELNIKSFVQAEFKDKRLISISLLEDDTMLAIVENTESEERSELESIWLTKESFIGMISTAMMYFNMSGEDLEKLLKDSFEKDEIEYGYSNNLNPDSLIDEKGA